MVFEKKHGLFYKKILLSNTSYLYFMQFFDRFEDGASHQAMIKLKLEIESKTEDMPFQEFLKVTIVFIVQINGSLYPQCCLYNACFIKFCYTLVVPRRYTVF